MGSIYLITNNENGMQYVGQTKNCVAQRFAQHIDSAYRYYRKKQTDFYRHIVDAGENVFNVFSYEIIENCEDSNLNEREIYWIGKLQPKYNWSHRNEFFSDAYAEDICKLYSEGHTVIEIRIMYQCRHDEITKILKDNGFEIIHSRPSERNRKKVYHFDDYGCLIKEYSYAAECAKALGAKRDNVRMCALENMKKGALRQTCCDNYVSYLDRQPYIYKLINHNTGESVLLKTKKAVELEIAKSVGKFTYFSQIRRKGRKTYYGFEIIDIQEEDNNETFSL